MYLYIIFKYNIMYNFIRSYDSISVIIIFPNVYENTTSVISCINKTEKKRLAMSCKILYPIFWRKIINNKCRSQLKDQRHTYLCYKTIWDVPKLIQCYNI
jgi:hypothetical protein